jgi:hypothetical protein
MGAVEVVQKLWGTKHPEGRQLTEQVYREMIRSLLIKDKNPLDMNLKLDKRKMLPDENIVK